MSASPRQALIAGADVHPAEAIRDSCREQGCTCGEDLVVVEEALTAEQQAEHRRRFGAVGATAWHVRYDPACPLLARLEGRL